MAAELSRLATALLAGLCAAARLAAQSDTAVAGETTATMLRHAGATRTSDLLPLSAPWQVSTIDGFTWQAAPPGGGSFTSFAPTVLVDGRRVEADLLGRLDLDRAGAPLDQLGRVEFVELPRLVAGRLTTRGLLHLHTRDPEAGTTAGVWYATGTEIGDPGPFAFTPAGGENVDRLGHDISAAASHRTPTWFVSGALAASERIPTDPAIADRYRAALGPVPRLEATSLSLRVGARTGVVRHRLSLRHTNSDGVLALAPLDAEVGVADRATAIGLAGSAAGSHGTLTWDVAYTEGRTSPRGPAGRPAIEWETGTTEAWVELDRRATRLSTAGLRFRRVAAEARSPLARPTISLATVYAELSPSPGATLAPVLAAAVTAGDGDVGVVASLAHVWAWPGGSTLEAVVAYERAAASEITDVWSWTERGYRLFEASGADAPIVGVRRGPERLAADLRWAARPSERMRLTTRGFFRRERRLSVEHGRPATLVHGAGGEVVGGTIDLAWSASRDLIVGGAYWLGVPVGGDSVYRDARAVVPRHGARVSFAWVPRQSLELWLAAAWRSGSSWDAFESSLDGAVTLDAAVTKGFWANRLRAQVVVRNLLGGELRFHPRGAVFAPTVFLRIAGGLPRWP